MYKKKTPQRKIEANRRNAQKSSGPRTSEGKRRSSRNAVKHGLLARHVVLTDHANEDPREFDELLEGLMDDYQPQGMIEKMLVERLAASFWRLRRAYRFEAESIAQANKPNVVSQVLSELSPLASEPAEKVLPSGANLDKLIRYESMIDREMLRTVVQLERRQRCRRPEAPAQRVRPVPDDSGAAGSVRTNPEHPAKAPAPNEPTAEPTAREPNPKGGSRTQRSACVGSRTRPTYSASLRSHGGGLLWMVMNGATLRE